MFVLGTAGHVDHGKSSFLRALTGMEPDRLPEEKKRGMTIDLNFVWWTTTAGEKVGIVDVPGHHRFVKNMISGAMSIDAFLFIVAADDGWMPQSQEHLEVLKSLGVRRGIGILAKADLADEEWLGEMEKEFRAKLTEGFGGAPEILRFALPDPTTLIPIRQSVERLLGQLPLPRDTGAARLWVDRVFLPKGLGVVATGTLREGSLREGDELRIFPSGKTAVVKTLQSYHASVSEARPVARVAVQLAKIQSGDLTRGMLLQKKRAVPRAKRLDARVDFFQPPKDRNRELAFHLGTLREPALVVTMGKPQGNRAWVRIKLDHPVPARCGDRFVLRTPGEEFTVGAGIIADPVPPGLSHVKALQRLSVWEETPSGWIAYARRREPCWDLTRLVDESVYTLVELQGAMLSLGPVQSLGDEKYIEAAGWQKAKEAVIALLFQSYQKTKEGLAEGTLLQALRTSQGWSIDLAKVLVDELLRVGTLRRRGNGVILAQLAQVADPAEQEARRKVEAWLEKGGGQPVPLRDLGAEEAKLKKTVLTMAKEAELLNLGDDHFLARAAYGALQEKLSTYIQQKGQATTSELREFLGTSRKNAVLVLERMDRDRITYLKDGVRRLLRSP